MKHSSSYKKRKRKTLNTSLSKRKKNKIMEGGSQPPELFLFNRLAPYDDSNVKSYIENQELRIASLEELKNIELHPRGDDPNGKEATIRFAQSSNYGWIKDDSNYVYRPTVLNTSNITLGLDQINQAGYERITPVSGSNYGVWCHGIKPPEGTANIMAYNNSFYSTHHYPHILTIHETGATKLNGLYINDDETIYMSDNTNITSLSRMNNNTYERNIIQRIFSNTLQPKGFTMDGDNNYYVINSTSNIYVYDSNGQPLTPPSYSTDKFTNIIDIDTDSKEDLFCLNASGIQQLKWNNNSYTPLEIKLKLDNKELTLTNASGIHVSYARGHNDCIYIADTDKNRILFIPMIAGTYYNVSRSENPTITNSVTLKAYVIAGNENGTAGFDISQDGGLATSAMLNKPTSIITDSSGNVYIADTGNHRIRKVDYLTGKITTIAGTYKNYSYTLSQNGIDQVYHFPKHTCDGVKTNNTYDHYGILYPIQTVGYLNGDSRCQASRTISGHIGDQAPGIWESDLGTISEYVYIESPTCLKILETYDANDDPIKYLYFVTKDSVCRMKITEPPPPIDNIVEPPAPLHLVPMPYAYQNINFNTDIPKYGIDLAKDILHYYWVTKNIGDIIDTFPLKIKRMAIDYNNDLYYTVGNAVLRQIRDTATNTYSLNHDPNVIAGQYTIDDKNHNLIYSDANYLAEGRRPIFAQLDKPTNVAVDNSGNLYIVDTYNHIVRKVTNKEGNRLTSDHDNNIITTVAGIPQKDCYLDPVGGYSGEDLPATCSKLNEPHGICFDSDNNLFIADSGNHIIRMVAAKDYDMSDNIYYNYTPISFPQSSNIRIKTLNIYGINCQKIKKGHMYTVAGVAPSLSQTEGVSINPTSAQTGQNHIPNGRNVLLNYPMGVHVDKNTIIPNNNYFYPTSIIE